jgi:hypothetical protein
MVLWNSVVMDAFAPGMITKVSYVQSIGLTLFVRMFIQSYPRIVYMIRPKRVSLHSTFKK